MDSKGTVLFFGMGRGHMRLFRKESSATSRSASSGTGAHSAGSADGSVELEAKFRALHFVRVTLGAQTEMRLQQRVAPDGKMYDNTFLGSELVSWLIRKTICKNAQEAMHVGSKLVLFGLIARVGDEGSEMFTCNLAPYQFTFTPAEYEIEPM